MIDWDNVYTNKRYGAPSQAIKIASGLLPQLIATGVKSCLDVGCGRGHLIENYSVGGIQVTGTEIVESLLRADLGARSVLPLSIAEMVKTRHAKDYDFVAFVDVLPYLATEEEIRSVLLWARDAPHGLLVANSLTSKDVLVDHKMPWWFTTVQECAVEPGRVNTPHLLVRDRAYMVWRMK